MMWYLARFCCVFCGNKGLSLSLIRVNSTVIDILPYKDIGAEVTELEKTKTLR